MDTGLRQNCSGAIASRNRWRVILRLLFAAVCTGCGQSPALAPVKGKVLLNGKPLNSGSVGTIPSAGRGSHGDIQADGTFELHTYSMHDGALLGKHKVAVAAYQDTGAKGPESGYGKLTVPERYTNPESSGLTIDVKEGEVNTPTLELTSP
jgi:hypothetical protein